MTKRTRTRARALLVAAGFAALCVASVATGGCSAKKNTEILVGVQADVRIPTDIDEVQLRVFVDGALVFEPRASVADGTVSLPGSFGVVAGADKGKPVVVEVIGYVAGAPKVLRRARLTFVDGKTIYLRMPLTFACYAAPDCPADRTCVAGECKDATIDASTLAEFSTVTQVAGDRPGTGPFACFEAEPCLATSAAVAPAGVDGCTFTTPGGGPSTPFTPALVFPSTGGGALGFCDPKGSCKIPLDHDPQEGWEFVDPSHATFTLAPGLCAKLAQLGGHLEATSVCGEKTAARPICGPLSGEADPRPSGYVDRVMNLHDQATFSVDPVAPQHISYTIEIPPQGATRYAATLTLTSSVPGKKFRATLATTCADVPPPGAIEASSAGVIRFDWSAQSSTQYAQIVSEEATPFDVAAKLDGALAP